MDSKLRRWQLGGFLFTAAAGTLLHFLYDLSGESSFFAAISAVNESVWEHMKLLFVPMFVVALAEMVVFGDRYRCFWRVKLLGILVGLLIIPVIHYTYTGVLGMRIAWVDISTFYVAAVVVYLLETKLLTRCSRPSAVLELGAMLLVWALAFLFLFMTYAPPEIPLFQDPVTGEWGIGER